MFKDQTMEVLSIHKSLEILKKLPPSQKRDELISKIELWLNPVMDLSKIRLDSQNHPEYWRKYALFLEHEIAGSDIDLCDLINRFRSSLGG